jgi:hypothetical protein
MSDAALRNLAGVLLVVGLALGVAVSWTLGAVVTGLAVVVGISIEVRRMRQPGRRDH